VTASLAVVVEAVKEVPSPGDWGICLRCAAIVYVGPDLMARRPTEENWKKSRPGFRFLLEKVRIRVAEQMARFLTGPKPDSTISDQLLN
jgi:hypothetical protein